MNIPRHVAIIMDGNGRWAKAKGMPRSYGHLKGCDNLENIVYDAQDIGIKYLTVYAFSTENWKRAKEEVEGLMNLFRSYLKKCKGIAKERQICFKVIGDISAFPKDIQESVVDLEDFSKDFQSMYCVVALNYGGRDEMRRAMTRLGEDVKAGKLDPESITQDTISGYLDTAGIPDPDLMIRTSGEQRLSNFLLWQLAYTEFVFTDVHWPDFHKQELLRCIEQYNHRDRRFGNAKES